MKRITLLASFTTFKTHKCVAHSHSMDRSEAEVMLPWDIHSLSTAYSIKKKEPGGEKMQAWSSFTKGSFLSMYIQIYQLCHYVNNKVVCINQKLQLSQTINITTVNLKIQGRLCYREVKGPKPQKSNDTFARKVVTSPAYDSWEREHIEKEMQARLIVRNSTGLLTSSKKISQSCQALEFLRNMLYIHVFDWDFFFFCLWIRLKTLDHSWKSYDPWDQEQGRGQLWQSYSFTVLLQAFV